MSTIYPIIVKEGVIYFSTRLDGRSGVSYYEFTVEDFVKPYGFVVPDGRTGLAMIASIEHNAERTSNNTFINRCLVLDHTGTLHDITIAMVKGVVPCDLNSQVSTRGLSVLGGEEQMCAEANVLLRMDSAHPMDVLNHVARMNNDTNPCFVAVSISEMAWTLKAKGYTKNVFDVMDISRRRREALRTDFKENFDATEVVGNILEPKHVNQTQEPQRVSDAAQATFLKAQIGTTS